MKKDFIVHHIAIKKLIGELFCNNTELLYDSCLKYNICPNCGSNNIIKNRIPEPELFGGVVIKYTCTECDFKDESYF